MFRQALSFTAEELADMAAMYRSGWSTVYIAKKYNCLGGSIHRRLQARGVPLRDVQTRRRSRTVLHSHGYLLWDGEYVHRIVAEAWRGSPLQPGECVHHRDGDKANNHPDNLEIFASHAEHMSRSHATVWTHDRVASLVAYRKQGLTASQIAERLGLTRGAVNNRAKWLASPRPSRARVQGVK